VEACNLIHCLLPLGRSNFRVTRDQPQPGSFLNKREEPGNEVGKEFDNFKQFVFFSFDTLNKT
jgi:hypothetical protein